MVSDFVLERDRYLCLTQTEYDAELEQKHFWNMAKHVIHIRLEKNYETNEKCG